MYTSETIGAKSDLHMSNNSVNATSNDVVFFFSFLEKSKQQKYRGGLEISHQKGV